MVHKHVWTPTLSEVTQDTHGLSACGGLEAGSSWHCARKPNMAKVAAVLKN